MVMRYRITLLLLLIVSCYTTRAQRRQQQCPPETRADCFPRRFRPTSLHLYLGGPAGEGSAGITQAVSRRWDVYTGAGIPGIFYLGANYYLLASPDQRWALITGPSIALCPETPWYTQSYPGVYLSARVGGQYMSCKGICLGLEFQLTNDASARYFSGGLRLAYSFAQNE
jgi:hypothetical protein